MYIIATNVLHFFPQCKAKEAPIPVMPSYDPPATQHNDHSQICHSRTIIESHEKTTTNTYTSVINELITIKVIEQTIDNDIVWQ